MPPFALMDAPRTGQTLAFEQIIDDIRTGDIYQTNLTFAPRGRDTEADAANVDALAASEKARAPTSSSSVATGC